MPRVSERGRRRTPEQETRLVRALDELGDVSSRLDLIWDLVEGDLALSQELARLQLSATLLTRLARGRLLTIQTERAASA
jgi:hypothetical protein